MLWVKAFHIIAMVAWFAGLFYLPRLFVYHADTTDKPGILRFKTMERRLYYGITWPAGLLTSILGLWLLFYYEPFYLHAQWMQVKLGLVGLLWFYHLSCGYFLKRFKADSNTRSGRFFRCFNELPTVLLITIVLLAVLK